MTDHNHESTTNRTATTIIPQLLIVLNSLLPTMAKAGVSSQSIGVGCVARPLRLAQRTPAVNCSQEPLLYRYLVDEPDENS